jgi:hypothetical protein
VKWATRAAIHIDRAACAWLIRRCVDPAAEFAFVTDPAQVPADATAFDMRGVELSHHNGDCSFETNPAPLRTRRPGPVEDRRDHSRGRPLRRALRRPRGARLRRRAARAVDDRRRRAHSGRDQADLRRPLRVLPPRHPARPRARLTPLSSASGGQVASWPLRWKADGQQQRAQQPRRTRRSNARGETRATNRTTRRSTRRAHTTRRMRGRCWSIPSCKPC